MNLSQLNRILQQALLLPVFALLLTAASLYMQMRSANDTVGIIQMTDARTAQVALVAKLISDEESGLRGYETTCDERFLEPFNEASARLPAEFDKLSRLTVGDAEQQFHLDDLHNEHQTWRDAFALPIVALVRAGGRSSDVNLNLYGKSLMDQVRQDIDAITLRAEKQRSERIAQWQRQVRSMVRGLIAIALGMGVLIGLFMRSRLHAVSSAYSNSLQILGKRAEEIFQSEQRLRTTLDSIADGVITCDADGRIQMMNPLACELVGWKASEAVGKPLDDVFYIIDEHSREIIENPVAKVRKSKTAIGRTDATILVRKDASELFIADSAAPVRDQTGEMAGTVLVFRDITLERRTQEALLASEKLAVAGRLAASIAHEIHNPLDSVANLLYLMKNGVSEEESRMFINMAERELARVTHISRAMLGLYRESRAPVPVDLREIINDTLLLMDHRFQEIHVAIHADLPKGIVVDGFPAELRQVFTNLITNAAEASKPGGVVRISAAPHAASIGQSGQKLLPGALVVIADNGNGISTDVMPNLFQPFFTTKGERGTGLGLWVSRGIIHKHGGDITLTSDTDEEHHGTVVSVFLAEKPTISMHVA